jgi:hypothetical protein
VTNLKAANLLLQKYPAESFVVETRIDASALKEGELAGVTVMGTKYAIVALRRGKTGMDLACFSGDPKDGTKELSTAPWPGESAVLRVQFKSGSECEFMTSVDGKDFKSLQKNFHATPDGWIGGKIGIFSTATSASADRGYADFDYFRFSNFSDQTSGR